MMLTKEDLANIRGLMKDEMSGMKTQMLDMNREIITIKGEVTELKDEVSGIKGEVTGLKDEVSGIKGEVIGLKDEVTGLKDEVTRLKGEVADIKINMVTKKEFKVLENRVDDLQQDIHELRDYSHKKFVLIENEVVPKISALFEMSDSYVKQEKCFKRREQVDKKLNSLESLEVIAKIHGEQIGKHDEILDKLVTNAG